MDDFERLFSLDNLFRAWQKYRRGKTDKSATAVFERRLEENLFTLSDDLLSCDYHHGGYHRFIVRDFKRRTINTATVRDKVVHQAVYDYLAELYEPVFIKDSFSSRVGKGTDRAIEKLTFFLRDECAWRYGQCFVLKCDIRKYFDTIDHAILLGLMRRRAFDVRVNNVIEVIIRSFESRFGLGMPLGNITSQIFANIYLHELDCFALRKLKVRKYVRYNDDFVIIHSCAAKLEGIAVRLQEFLRNELLLGLPSNKMAIRKFTWGAGFLGRIILPGAVIFRSQTKRKIEKRFSEENRTSYLGLLSKANEFAFGRKLLAGLPNEDSFKDF